LLLLLLLLLWLWKSVGPADKNKLWRRTTKRKPSVIFILLLFF
jgi:uncharacterized protein YdaU (DUF1376 family)